MAAKLNDYLTYLGLDDPQRDVFDELIPLSHGTSYNSYLIEGGEKVALIDTMYLPLAKPYLAQLASLGKKVDYIITQHVEQDHSGVLSLVLEKFPAAKVYTSSFGRQNIINLLGIDPNRITVVKDQEQLSLGNKTLRFIMAPNVHWPDTMFTYLVEDKILFTCDFLGAHQTLADQVWANPGEGLAQKAKEYFAEIMLPFRKMCAKYETLISNLNPCWILPSHGPLYKDDGVKFILDCYKEWSSDQCANLVLLPYVSMYQTSLELVKALAAQLAKAQIKAIPFDLIRDPLRDLACYLVDAQTIILACSMVLGGPHPAAMNFAYLAKLLRPKAKYLGIIGSFGWGGKLVEPLLPLFEGLGAEIFPAITFKGKPQKEDFLKVQQLGEAIIKAHQS